MGRFKMVVLGDGAVGKTSLLISYCMGKYPAEYIPTVFDQYTQDIQLEDGSTHEVSLWDTAGGEDYHRLRPLSYPATDIFMLCFDLARRESFTNISDMWMAELDLYLPEAQRMLVGCKSDLRAVFDDQPDVVSYKEATDLAKRLDMCYFETSSLKMKGLEQCFKQAVRLAKLGSRVKRTKQAVRLATSPHLRPFSSESEYMHFREQKYWGRTNDRITPRPNILPQKERSPPVHVEESTFGSDWHTSREQSLNTDLVFVVDGKHRLDAHSVLLCCASDVFHQIFNIKETQKLEKISSAVSRVHTEDSGDRPHTVIELDPNIQKEPFQYFLHFIYTGQLSCPDDLSLSLLDQLQELSQIFNVPTLETFCQNVRNEDPELNPSLAEYTTQITGQSCHDLFLNNSALSDVVFKVNGTKVFAHRCVLSARSKVLAAMLGANFRESHSDVILDDVDLAGFLVVLEYLYTDRATLDHVDPVTVLVLADHYCLPRLISLCERQLSQSITDAHNDDVIELLIIAKRYNAAQLPGWCRHHIAMDYAHYSTSDDYRRLDPEDVRYIELHQWPPQWYIHTAGEDALNPKLKHARKCAIL